MDRKEKLLSGLNVSSQVGAEIGALCRPVVTRAEGNIYYIDHASTETLRDKYKNDPNVDIEKIVEVDAIWGNLSLSQALLAKKVDYVVASHVIEHVPDLVGWFTEINGILKAKGQLCLAIPDKRFTFDLLREESRFSDVLAAHVMQARIPQPQAIIDHFINVRYDINAGEIWRGGPSIGSSAHTVSEALFVARDSVDHGTYHDVHCWVFTPMSFARICRQLVENGLLRMSCVNFYDTSRNELEFFVRMQECDDARVAAVSWARMEKTAFSFHVETEHINSKSCIARSTARLRNIVRRMRALRHKLIKSPEDT